MFPHIAPPYNANDAMAHLMQGRAGHSKFLADAGREGHLPAESVAFTTRLIVMQEVAG